jgi:ATP-dependent Lon protease
MATRSAEKPGDAGERLPVLPLRDVVFFPHVIMPLVVGRPASLAAVNAASAGDGRLLLVAQRDSDVQEPSASQLHRVGVIARISQLAQVGNGSSRVLLEGMQRARVTRYVPGAGALTAVVHATAPSATGEGAELQARGRHGRAGVEGYGARQRRNPPAGVSVIQATDGIARQAYGMAAHLAVRHETRQKLLEAEPPEELLRLLSEVISGENDLRRLER